MKQIYKYTIYMVAIMLLSSCYPIRRVGLLQTREGLPEYEKGEYECVTLTWDDKAQKLDVPEVWDVKVVVAKQQTERG